MYMYMTHVRTHVRAPHDSLPAFYGNNNTGSPKLKDVHAPVRN